MKLNIVCHIGLHKTASGTLQRQFFPACSGLRLFTTQQEHTSELIQMVTRVDPIFFDAGAARNLLASRMDPENPNLLSNESLSGPPYAGLIEYALDHRSSVIQNLSEAFPEARILVVLRRQDSLARSLYRQYLKRGGTAKIDRFYGVARGGKPAMMSTDRFRYHSYLRFIAEKFPAGLKIMLFEDFQLNRKAFLSEMCEYIGVSCPDIQLNIENATKLGPAGMELSRWANFAFRSMVNNGPFPMVPRKQYGRWKLVSPVEYLHDYWPGNGRASQLASSVCTNILKDVAQDNRLVDDTFGIGLKDKAYY